MSTFQSFENLEGGALTSGAAYPSGPVTVMSPACVNSMVTSHPTSPGCHSIW